MKRLRMEEIVWPVDNPYRPPWAISCDEARKRCEQRREVDEARKAWIENLRMHFTPGEWAALMDDPETLFEAVNALREKVAGAVRAELGERT